jgi:hypothetical protein
VRRAAGWSARYLRIAGKIAEAIGYLLIFIGSRGELQSTEIPEFWTETRRGRLKGVRGWFRSTVLSAILLAPLFVGFAPERLQFVGSWVGAILASVVTFGVASAPVAIVAVLIGRAISAPRPMYDMATTAFAAGIGGIVLLLPQEGVPLFLWYWPATVGVIWGWLYWFFAYRPRPPYRHGHA